MNWRNILIALGVLVVLIIVMLLVFREKPHVETKAEFPAIDKDAVTKIWVASPVIEKDVDEEADPVIEETTLVRTGEGEESGWRLSEPVDYDAYDAYVDTLLTRLEEMEIVDVAVESKDNWEALEVDDAHAVHVKVWEGETRRAEFWLGAYKTGHTMLRLPGDDRVYKVAGSLQRVFGKRTSDWREKTILAEESKNVTRIALTTPEGEWTFDKDGEDWVQALEEGEEGLEHFDGKKLRSLVSSVARLRAADFADDVSPSDAGLDSPRGRIAFTVTTPPAEEPEVKDADRMIEEQDAGEDPMAPEPAEVETFRILVGDDVDDETYIMVEGDPQIYLVATRVAERLLPGPDKLTTPPKPEGEAEAAPVAPPMNMGQDSSIPPEVMKQVQAEIQKQKMMKQLMQKQAP